MNYQWHQTQNEQLIEDDTRRSCSINEPKSTSVFRQLEGLKTREGNSGLFSYRLELALEREYITNDEYKELKCQ